MGSCKPLGSLNSFLSYAPQLSGTKSYFLVHLMEWGCGRWLLLAFPQFLSNHRGGWQHPRSPHSRLEARNRWWLWHFLFIDMAGDNFISHCYLWCSHQDWFQTTVGKIMCFHAKSGIAHSVLPVGTRLYPCTTFELTVLRVVGTWCWNLHNSTSKKKKKNFQH